MPPLSGRGGSAALAAAATTTAPATPSSPLVPLPLHGRGPPRPTTTHHAAAAALTAIPWTLVPAAGPNSSCCLTSASLAIAAAAGATTAAVAGTPAAAPRRCLTGRRSRVIAAAWRGAGALGGGSGDGGGSWEGRRAVGAAAAAAAAAAALDGGSGGDGGPDGPALLERPTAEVRMSMVSERAAATSALGPEVAERMQADCIRAVRSWCKLGYGDHVVVHVEHQQLATPAGAAPGLLSTTAVTFAGPDGRRHAAVAVSVGVLCAAAAPDSMPPPPVQSQPPSPSRVSVNNQFGGGSGGGAADGSPSASPPRRRRPVAAAHVAPGSSAPSLDPLPGLSLHWGCCHGPGQRWHGPAAGWHTLPAVSYDAGKGAWQTPMAVRQAIPLDLDPTDPADVLLRMPPDGGGAAAGDGGSVVQHGIWVAVYTLVLQLPWEGPIRNGGLCFVLKTARNQWMKARVLPPPASPSSSAAAAAGGGGGSGGAEADFWVSTSSLPLVAGGVPLLPDVFRMSHSDSLPQVVVATASEPPAQVLTAAAAGSAAGTPVPTRSGNGDSHTANSSGTPPQGGGGGTAPSAAAVPDSSPQPQQPQQPPPSQPGLETDLLGAAATFRPPPRLGDALLRSAERYPLAAPAGRGGGGQPMAPCCGWMLDHIVQREPSAERSLMHRYNAGADLVEMAAGSGEVAEALAAVTAWLRFSASRLLVWNRNYNVKPREISTAQARLAAALAALGAARGPAATAAAAPPPGGSSRGGATSAAAAVGALVRVALAAVGRGGAGEVGQRIRDEILAIQQRNGCKGGMMEEWHQKLHNNTSPDDVVICRALLDYIAAGLDVTAYWRTLSSAGITAQRLASFDRPITSEPRFSGQQATGLQRDLTAYLQTLQAVHGGDDLASAAANVLGYEETDMKGKRIVVQPVSHVATPSLERHLRALLALQRHLASPAAAATAAAAAATGPRGSNGTAATTAPATAAAVAGAHRPTDVASLYGLPGAVRLMEMVVEARHLIRPFVEGGDSACGGRLVDVLFLDLALDSTLRTAVEAHVGDVKRAIADGTAIYIAAAASAAGHTSSAVPTGTSAAASRAGGVGAVVGGVGGIGGVGAGGRPMAGSVVAAVALTQALEVVRLTTENAALSCCPNDDLVYSNKWLRLLVAQEDPRDARDRMLQALAIAERLKRCMAEQAAALMGLIQPPADELGARLRLPRGAVAGAGEEAVRGGSGAPLAQLLAALEPALRQATGGGVWQIVSRGSDRPVFAGRLRLEPRLDVVQHEVMTEPTVLLVEGITGAEEIPEGCVAVLVGGVSSGGGGCPDVLSHSAVRARNLGVLLAGCYSAEMVTRIRSHAGSRVMVRLEGADVNISFSTGGGTFTGSGSGSAAGGPSTGTAGAVAEVTAAGTTGAAAQAAVAPDGAAASINGDGGGEGGSRGEK